MGAKLGADKLGAERRQKGRERTSTRAQGPPASEAPGPGQAGPGRVKGWWGASRAGRLYRLAGTDRALLACAAARGPGLVRRPVRRGGVRAAAV